MTAQLYVLASVRMIWKFDKPVCECGSCKFDSASCLQAENGHWTNDMLPIEVRIRKESLYRFDENIEKALRFYLRGFPSAKIKFDGWRETAANYRFFALSNYTRY